MQPQHLAAAAARRADLIAGALTPAAFRDALAALPFLDRDAWVDRLLGLGELPDDDPALPRGCVPYLPCPVDALARLVTLAEIDARDVFVDIGAGLGRAAAVVQLMTGATAVGVEIQPALVALGRVMAAGAGLSALTLVEGDAGALEAPDPAVAAALGRGTVFFLYCPFGGARLAACLARLEAIARDRPIRVACLDLPLPALPWLTPVSSTDDALVLYRSAAR